MKIHIKFIFLILAFKAVNKSAHTSFCPQVHMLFLPILTLSCSFCVSPTQDFVLGFLPTPGLPTSVVCMCIYITYCYILYIYILPYAYIKCDLPFNSSLKLTSFPKGKGSGSTTPFASFVIHEFIPERDLHMCALQLWRKDCIYFF